jgi:hypothetical protein
VTELEVVARGTARGVRVVEQLVCHPRLQLVACLDSQRPAVHVWGFGGEQFRELGSVGLSSAPYGDALGWERLRRTPAVAWHPEQPFLVVAGEDGVLRWTPAGVSALDGAPVTAGYRSLAFSPDGQTLWGSPSFRVEGGDWESSDVLHLVSGAVGAGPWWDTGVSEHPGGGLVATLASDQGATYCLFARVDQESAPTEMRLLNRALILDCDGYGTPLFSPDGRHMAIRGNAYDHSVDVFEFPSLRRVLATTLGEPSPGYPYPHIRTRRNGSTSWKPGRRTTSPSAPDRARCGSARPPEGWPRWTSRHGKLSSMTCCPGPGRQRWPRRRRAVFSWLAVRESWCCWRSRLLRRRRARRTATPPVPLPRNSSSRRARYRPTNWTPTSS